MTQVAFKVNGRLVEAVDTSPARAMPGVARVVTADDIPGLNAHGRTQCRRRCAPRGVPWPQRPRADDARPAGPL